MSNVGPYPAWICSACGNALGNRKCNECATWHVGECDICGIEGSVTEPRDFGHLRNGFRSESMNEKEVKL